MKRFITFFTLHVSRVTLFASNVTGVYGLNYLEECLSDRDRTMKYVKTQAAMVATIKNIVNSII